MWVYSSPPLAAQTCTAATVIAYALLQDARTPAARLAFTIELGNVGLVYSAAPSTSNGAMNIGHCLVESAAVCAPHFVTTIDASCMRANRCGHKQ